MDSIKIYEHWCKKQQEDYETMMQLMDDFCASAVGLSTSGAQGYQQFIQSRDTLRKTLRDMSKNYRYVE